MKLFRSLLMVAFLLCGALSVLSAQTDSTKKKLDDKIDSFSFEEIPQIEEKVPYFAVGGGATGTLLFANFDALNLEATNFFSTSVSFGSTLFLSGGQGFVGFPFIANSRIGIVAMGGSSSLMQDRTIAGVETSRRMQVGVSLTGVSFDYAFTPAKGLAVVPGATVGFGAMTVNTSSSLKSRAWTGIPGTPNANNFAQELRSNFIMLQPNLNIEYTFTPFTMLRVNAGYSYSIMGDWKTDGLSTMSGVPDAINARGLTLQAGIFFGLFNN
jgi:hypothetical protein